MIQLALVGLTPIVVEEGIKKSVPDKLYILHTKNESKYKFETEATKLKTKIENQHKILTILLKVDAFDMDEIIRTILTTISKEKKREPTLTKKDFYHRIGICRREAKESKYWLELLLHANKSLREKIDPLIDEGLQLARIFATISKSQK